MTNAILNVTGINQDDLLKPSSTRKYPLGLEVTVVDTATDKVKKYMYVKAHAALVANTPYVIAFSTVAGSEVKTAAPITDATDSKRVVVAPVAFTNAYYGFVQFAGECKVAVSGTHTVDDYLELTSAATQLVANGTSGSTVFDDKACAICADISTGDEVASAILLGATVQTAAS